MSEQDELHRSISEEEQEQKLLEAIRRSLVDLAFSCNIQSAQATDGATSAHPTGGATSSQPASSSGARGQASSSNAAVDVSYHFHLRRG